MALIQSCESADLEYERVTKHHDSEDCYQENCLQQSEREFLRKKTKNFN